MTALEGALSHCPVVAAGHWGAGGCRAASTVISVNRHPPPLPARCSPQSLGRATLAEAKFTFLCGAWGCVQSQGCVGQE